MCGLYGVCEMLRMIRTETRKGFSSFYHASDVFTCRRQPGAIAVKTNNKFGRISMLGGEGLHSGEHGYAGQQRVSRTIFYPPLFCGVVARFTPIISTI